MSRCPLILVAEDEDNDFFLLNWAFGKQPEAAVLARASDGVQAMDYLSGIDEFADRTRFPLPDLVLLDLKMPRRDGFEVLQSIRSNPLTKALITIVLSSSREERDVKRAYRLGANSYVAKPNDTRGFLDLTRVFIDYWLRWVQRPEVGAAPQNPTLMFLPPHAEEDPGRAEPECR